jgi:hypothetical protein
MQIHLNASTVPRDESLRRSWYGIKRHVHKGNLCSAFWHTGEGKRSFPSLVNSIAVSSKTPCAKVAYLLWHILSPCCLQTSKLQFLLLPRIQTFSPLFSKCISLVTCLDFQVVSIALKKGLF